MKRGTVKVQFLSPPNIIEGKLKDLVDIIYGKKTIMFVSGHYIGPTFVDEIVEINEEPKIEDIQDWQNKLKKKDYNCVVGIGGGSVLDFTKMVGGELGLEKVLVPTTYSGAEATHEVVVTDKGKKRSVKSKEFLADTVLLDSSLILSMPSNILRMSAFDSLAHCIECIDSSKSSILTNYIAKGVYKQMLEGITSLNFDKVKRDYQRYAFFTGLAFGNSGTSLGHALSYPLSNRGIPHGQAVANVLHYALNFNGNLDLSQRMSVRLDVLELNIPFVGDPEEMAKEVMQDHKHLSNNPKKVKYTDVLNIYHKMQHETK